MRTIKLPCEGLFKEKGSKFYAYAFPLETAFQLKDFFRNRKRESSKGSSFLLCASTEGGRRGLFSY